MIKRNYYKVVRVFPDPSSYFYIKNESMSVTRIEFDNSWLNTVNLEYSFDKVNWTLASSTIRDVPADSFVYFRNTSGTFKTYTYGGCIFMYQNFSIGGDIRTLFNYTDVENVTAIPENGFANPFVLFDESICIDISNLSFRGITEIGVRGLYMTFSSYRGTKGIDLRDVTTLGEGALYMLYYGCSNLTEVYAPNVSTWDTSKSQDWLSSVAPTGVVYKPSTLDILTNNYSGIPSGWTTQDYPTI